MKYLLAILLYLLIGCNDITGEREYETIEVDMEEFCVDKRYDEYYIGPKDGCVTYFINILSGDYNENIEYIYGKGFKVLCPNNYKATIKWN